MPEGRAREALGLLAAALLSASAPAAAGAQGRFAVELDEPLAGARTALPLVEVRGHAGVSRADGYDLVIVLDLSESTLADTGVDVDGDGPRGRTDPALLDALAARPVLRESALRALRDERDFDDTVLAVELEAARALLERLDARRFRVALLVFSDEARVVAPLGSSPSRLRRALEEIRTGFQEELRGTNFAAALRGAREALAPDPAAPPAARQRAIVFLSDGAPTLPVHGERARERAVEEAAVAGLAGVRIFGFALGREGRDALSVLGEMASLTGGRVDAVLRPAEVVARLRALRLTELAALQMENQRTGEPARALRVFPDGSFDGFVSLEPGANPIRVRATSEGGDVAVAEVTVHRGGDPAGEAARARDLLEELQRRTEEMRLWAEMERRRRVQRRELELEPMAPTGDAAPSP